ncbi:hypothetical protein SEPCBS119000_002127 [Sporothrix epigloea]|uniref:TM7S3/TM198-like domain-containing protein n=1 Tax=Sporothrix epigloea TaxID=1892477 RepID=A0ABP0DEG0_9PEZI
MLINSTSSLNSTIFNATIPTGQLPLQPAVTPAWGVAGIILLLTGVVYALIGVRNEMLHTFFSTAYLASLGTTVLIIYVMSPPISKAIQGAYLVAVVCTGLVLGGIAIVFKEITDGFGCLLGGFSIGMWLMCLRQGGLIQSTSGSIIFIVAFTAGAYAFYFSHWTRHYALMICIAFGGATVTVMGIDAFSRAGLKEFWAYIWNLNSSLFPLGTVTYPITKGIRVELAAIILIFFAGLVSQIKLWHLVQERRAKRDAERIEDEQKLAKEEENVGRQVEAANARDREAWEATYGDGTYAAPLPNSGSSDSGVGDMDGDEKHMARSQTSASVSRQSRVGDVMPNSDVEGGEAEQAGSIEMAEMRSAQPEAAMGIYTGHEQQGSAVMVHVSQDEYPEGSPPVSRASEHSPRRSAAHVANDAGAMISSSPTVVPLPFKVPVGHADGDDDRSTVATFADEDEDTTAAVISERVAKTQSTLAKRLSQNSVQLLRSISQRSKRVSIIRDKSGCREAGHSQEELVSPRSSRMAFREDDDNSSLAVTVDGMSSSDEDEDDRHMLTGCEVDEKLERGTESELPKAADGDIVNQVTSSEPTQELAESHQLPAATTSTNHPEMPSSSSATDSEKASEASEATELPTRSTPSVPVAKSTVSVSSVSAALTKDSLPRPLSRVAMSYRTNEWAKHLSNADAPELEALQLGVSQQQPKVLANGMATASNSNVPISTSPVIDDGEAAAPVNVAALQQTAETGAPAPAAPRSASAMSAYGVLSRSNSRQSLSTPDLAMLGGAGTRASYMSTASSVAAGGNSLGSGYRSTSAGHLTARTIGLHNEPIAEENDAATEVGVVGDGDAGEAAEAGSNYSPIASRMSVQPPIPGVVSFNAPQTLIGQREMLLRRKSQQGMYIGGPVVNSASMASLMTTGNTSSMALPLTAPVVPSSGASDSASASSSMYNFYPGAGPAVSTPDLNFDDIPMNQRREMIRQSGLLNLSRPQSVGTGYFGQRNGLSASASMPTLISTPPTPSAGSVPFNSHQPKRDQAHLPSTVARQVQLATFRQSVAMDLRNGANLFGKGSRESLSSPYLGGGGSAFDMSPTPYNCEHEVQQSIDTQRSFLMQQKEAEAQRREMDRLEKERKDRAFEERMRRGDLLEAHNEAMRRMQALAGK